MSGLTLGLMTLTPVDLEVLMRSGSEMERRQAATILPVVTRQHELLVTLLLCNALAMEIGFPLPPSAPPWLPLFPCLLTDSCGLRGAHAVGVGDGAQAGGHHSASGHASARAACYAPPLQQPLATGGILPAPLLPLPLPLPLALPPVSCLPPARATPSACSGAPYLPRQAYPCLLFKPEKEPEALTLLLPLPSRLLCLTACAPWAPLPCALGPSPLCPWAPLPCRPCPSSWTASSTPSWLSCSPSPLCCSSGR